MRTPKNFKDITGQTFSRLKVIQRHGTNSDMKATWLCRCDCGTEKVISGKELRSGKIKSCGCLNSENTSARNFKHGLAVRGEKHPLYSTWGRIKDRCHNPSCSDYYLYGDKGVSMCDKWRNSFLAFIADVGERPPGTSIDRYPNKDGNYEPGNVRWGTDEMQANNKRNNHVLEFNGKTMSVMMWARETGIHHQTILYRLKHGMSVEAALTIPPHKKSECPAPSPNTA